MIEKIQELARQIRKLPGTDADCSTFPSGSAMLDVRRGGRLFVMSYSPMQRFGVDEVGEHDGFLTSYAFTCDDFDPAAQRLWQLVDPQTPGTNEEQSRQSDSPESTIRAQG